MKYKRLTGGGEGRREKNFQGKGDSLEGANGSFFRRKCWRRILRKRINKKTKKKRKKKKKKKKKKTKRGGGGEEGREVRKKGSLLETGAHHLWKRGKPLEGHLHLPKLNDHSGRAITPKDRTGKRLIKSPIISIEDTTPSSGVDGGNAGEKIP